MVQDTGDMGFQFSTPVLVQAMVDLGLRFGPQVTWVCYSGLGFVVQDTGLRFRTWVFGSEHDFPFRLQMTRV